MLPERYEGDQDSGPDRASASAHGAGVLRGTAPAVNRPRGGCERLSSNDQAQLPGDLPEALRGTAEHPKPS